MPVYCEDSDIDDVYGTVNVDSWADLDSDQDAVKIAARRLRARERAYIEINDLLRNGPYSIPFITVPDGIKYTAAIYSGTWLYDNRGIVDYDNKGRAQDQLTGKRKEFAQRISRIKSGALQVAATVHNTHPSVVK